MRYLVAGLLGLVASLTLTPVAQADDVLCSSNIAYRHLPAHVKECKDVAINSHGGGGAYDADGDGTPASSDSDDLDPNVN